MAWGLWRKIKQRRGKGRLRMGWVFQFTNSGHFRYLCSIVIDRVIFKIDPKGVREWLSGIFEGRVFQVEEIGREKFWHVVGAKEGHVARVSEQGSRWEVMVGPDRQGLVSHCKHFGYYFDWEGQCWTILGRGIHGVLVISLWLLCWG